MNGISNFIENIRREFNYSIWALWNIVSGFDALEYFVNDEYVTIRSNEIPCNPYWVCPLFYSGRRMPLPFFTNPDAKIGWLQKQAIALAAIINPRSYKAAQEACAWYEHNWEENENSQDTWYESDDLIGNKTLSKLGNYAEMETEEEDEDLLLREIPSPEGPMGFGLCQ
jgi:hypothetical protein